MNDARVGIGHIDWGLRSEVFQSESIVEQWEKNPGILNEMMPPPGRVKRTTFSSPRRPIHGGEMCVCCHPLKEARAKRSLL